MCRTCSLMYVHTVWALRPQARVEGVAAKQVLEEIMAKIKPAHTEE